MVSSPERLTIVIKLGAGDLYIFPDESKYLTDPRNELHRG